MKTEQTDNEIVGNGKMKRKPDFPEIPNPEAVSLLTAEFLTPTQVAALLGVTRWTLNYWRMQRQGPDFVMLTRGTIRYPRQALQSYLQRRIHKEGERVAVWGRRLAGSEKVRSAKLK
jgi:predicted DNA-binding transcriptional regulator AlpA